MVNIIKRIIEKINNLGGTIFKISIVIILLGFLYVYYIHTENDRYKYIKSDEEGAFLIKIFDSRTGETYNFMTSEDGKDNKWIKFSPLKSPVAIRVHTQNP